MATAYHRVDVQSDFHGSYFYLPCPKTDQVMTDEQKVVAMRSLATLSSLKPQTVSVALPTTPTLPTIHPASRLSPLEVAVGKYRSCRISEKNQQTYRTTLW